MLLLQTLYATHISTTLEKGDDLSWRVTHSRSEERIVPRLLVMRY